MIFRENLKNKVNKTIGLFLPQASILSEVILITKTIYLTKVIIILFIMESVQCKAALAITMNRRSSSREKNFQNLGLKSLPQKG